MSEYDAQAMEFLRKNHVNMTIRFLRREVNKNWGGYPRNRYSVTIITPRGKMKVPFWDSYTNTQKNKRPSEYDILACLEKYDPGSYEDFCSEYGYEPKYAMQLFMGFCYERGYSKEYAKRKFERYCNEMGDEDYLNALKSLNIYWEVKRQWEELEELFSEEELEELREIY